MSDLIMRDAETGRAAFMRANEDAWHRLGTVTAGAQTPSDALRIAHLNDWNVRTVPLVVPAQITLDGVTPEIAIPEHFAVVRDDPFDRSTVVPLGVVGVRYTPYQNEQLVQFLTDVVEQGGAVIETRRSAGQRRAGVLRNASRRPTALTPHTPGRCPSGWTLCLSACTVIGMTKRRASPAEQVEQAKQECRDRITDVAQRLAEARAQVDAIYAEMEQTVVDTVPVLGATAVQRLAGFKSRSSVTSIVDRFANADGE